VDQLGFHVVETIGLLRIWILQNYATRGHSLSAGVNRVSSLEPKAHQQEIAFKIICSNDRSVGIIGRGDNIIWVLQSETGATISVGPSVTKCEDQLITTTASASHELRYSPAQKAIVLVLCEVTLGDMVELLTAKLAWLDMEKGYREY